MVNYENNTLTLDEHCKIIAKYKAQLADERLAAQNSIDHSIRVHDALTEDLNKAIRLLKDNNLLDKYYETPTKTPCNHVNPKQ
jgi:hypothetical protein